MPSQDFDGSLAQSEHAHWKRFVAATEAECSIDRWMNECVGRSTEWIVCHLMETSEPDAAVLADLARRATSDAFFADVELTRGARDLLVALKAAGTPCAVVSSGLRAYICGCLERWGLADHVALVVAGDDDEPGTHKPDPAPYLFAARALGVDPTDAVAVEDSPSGIESALAAGVAVVALRNPANTGRGDLLGRALAVADDLTDQRPFLP